MKKIVNILTALIAALTSSCAESKHPSAPFDLPGLWEKDHESTDDELTLDSNPAGQQIIISVLRLKKEQEDIKELAGIAEGIFKIRLKAFLTLSKGTATFDKPESNSTETTIVCLCRGYVEKDKVRMAVRVEAGTSSKIIRSTSVYDYSDMPAEEFLKWSKTILAGIK